jgi:hypothetical protein
MYKILILIVCVGLFACNQSDNKQTSNKTWVYFAKNNNPILDDQFQPILFQYQELLKALKNKDTSYLKLVANNTIQLTDSLSLIKLPVDTITHKIWSDGMGNINAELRGMVMDNEITGWDELKMSVNMSGLQILNLLGQIGYKEHTIYIFNTHSSDLDDGYFWFGLQKNSKNPFNTEKSENASAMAILQEEIK